MKIYTYVKLDIDTGGTLEEEFFEYVGAVALCREKGGGPADADDAGTDQSTENQGKSGPDLPSGYDPNMPGGSKTGETMPDSTEGLAAKNFWSKLGVSWETQQLISASIAVVSTVLNPVMGISLAAKTAYNNYKDRYNGLVGKGYTPEQAAGKIATENKEWGAAIDANVQSGGEQPELPTTTIGDTAVGGGAGGTDGTDNGKTSPWLVKDPGVGVVQPSGGLLGTPEAPPGLLNQQSQSAHNPTAGLVPQSWLDYQKDPTPDNARKAMLDFNMMTFENPDLRPDELFGKLASIVGEEDANLIINQGKTGAATDTFGTEMDTISKMQGPVLSVDGKMVRAGGKPFQIRPTKTMGLLGDIAETKRSGLLKGYTAQNEMGTQRIDSQDALIKSIMNPRNAIWSILQGEKGAMERTKQAGTNQAAYANANNPDANWLDYLSMFASYI